MPNPKTTETRPTARRGLREESSSPASLSGSSPPMQSRTKEGRSPSHRRKLDLDDLIAEKEEGKTSQSEEQKENGSLEPQQRSKTGTIPKSSGSKMKTDGEATMKAPGSKKKKPECSNVKGGKKIKKKPWMLDYMQGLDNNVYGARGRQSQQEDYPMESSDGDKQREKTIFLWKMEATMDQEADLFCNHLAIQLKTLDVPEYMSATEEIQSIINKFRHASCV